MYRPIVWSVVFAILVCPPWAGASRLSALATCFTSIERGEICFERERDLLAYPSARCPAAEPVLETHGLCVAQRRDAAGPGWPVVRYRGGPMLVLTGEVGVQFRPRTTPSAMSRLFDEGGLEVTRSYGDAPRFFVVSTPSGQDPFDVARRLAKQPEIEWAEPSMLEPAVVHRVRPNDPLFSQGVLVHLSDELHRIETAWESTTGDPRVNIAVVDTGVDLLHPDLAQKLAAGIDVLDPGGDGSPQIGFEDDFHGTAVAGVAAAVTDNARGTSGVCWSCRVTPVRLIDAEGSIYVDRSKIFDAFYEAARAGAWIVNNSWGPWARDENGECIETPFSEFVAKGIEELANTRGGRGALVVWSAGNNACPTGLQPHLTHPKTFVVSSIDGLGNFHHEYSNWGEDIDACACEGNFTTDITGPEGGSDGTDRYLAKLEGIDPEDYVRNFRGTSAAAPVVTGIAGLMLSVNPNLTRDELFACLQGAVRPTDAHCDYGAVDERGHSPCYGFGLIDAVEAVKRAADGTCGGACRSDEDCPPGSVCDPGRSLCVWGEEGDFDTGDDSMGKDGDSETQRHEDDPPGRGLGTDSHEPASSVDQARGEDGGCGCRSARVVAPGMLELLWSLLGIW